MHVARIIVDRGVPQCQPGVHVYRILVDDNFADAAVPDDATGGLLDTSLTVGGRF